MTKLIAILAMALWLLPTQVHAVSSQWQRDGAVDVRLISALEGVGQKPVIPLGLEVRMEPGWHTYWRSPGVAGLPPDIDWGNSLSDEGNLKNATLLYPAPKRYIDQGLETIGYQGRVIFPIDAELRQTGKPLVVNATVNLLACSIQCVPKKFTVSLVVPIDAAVEGAEADDLNPARLLVPGSDPEAARITIKSVTNDGEKLNIEITAKDEISNPDVFIESNPEVPFSAPVIKYTPDHHGATLTVKPTDIKQSMDKLNDIPLTFTVVDEGYAIETPMQIESGDNEDHPGISFRMALLLAIMGGFLLNLMPCVLPVLSLKIMGLIGHGGGDKKEVRRSFLMSAAGIMFSFIVLALVTFILRKLGMSFGWGVQFQQPLFLISLILLLTVFAANMWGLFEINLPQFLADKLAVHHPKMAGDFATGALATLLATPCTAPFLGTAVGFALAVGTAREIFGIFTMLGVGMILPYLFIAFVPEFATKLPKPGKWMVHLRIVLGIALALTAVWLLWVLSSQIMVRYALTVASCMLGITALLGVRAKGMARVMVICGLIGFTGIAMSLALSGVPEPTAEAKAQKLWQPFDQAGIAIQVNSGRVVFVDITADWCLTCKANKKFVLSDDEISRRLFHSDVVAMQGDWTNPDNDISNFLHGFRRYGIPFDVVYGPGAPGGITLPELLSKDVVLNALNKASGR